MKMTPLDYVVVGSKDSAGVITKDTLSAAYSGNTLTLFASGLQQLHLDFIYTPLAGQDTRFAEVLLELYDEDDNKIGTKSVIVNSTTEVGVYSDRNDGLPITIPGEKNETSGDVIYGDWDGNIDAYKVKISARENGSSDFGTFYCAARLSELA